MNLCERKKLMDQFYIESGEERRWENDRKYE